jgi:hypothetical protein
VGGEKRNKELKMIPGVRFEEVEGHKYNFFSFRIPDVKLDLSLASELCQTVGDELFFLLGISFYKLVKHKICQVNFSKLLELL